MRIYIASDHAGFALKDKIFSYLKDDLKYEIFDKGAFVYDGNDDYPDFIKLVAREVSRDPETAKGIVIGGSGQGEAMVANRFKGVRAVVYYTTHIDILKLSREHNDANVLSLGARFLDENTALEAVKIWLETEFSGDERHIRRIRKLDEFSDAT